MMASSDDFTVTVHGKGAHGSTPWNGVDPVVTAALMVVGLQTIVSRQVDLTQDAAVVTVGILRGGVRTNIIPAEAELSGTIRALDPKTRAQLLAALRRTVTGIAESAPPPPARRRSATSTGNERETGIGDGGDGRLTA